MTQEVSVRVWHWTFDGTAQRVRIKFGEEFGRNWGKYRRLKISSRTGDVRVSGMIGMLVPQATKVYVLTEAQIVANPDVDAEGTVENQGHITAFMVVAPASDGFDSGPVDTTIGERDYLNFFNPVAGTATEVQVELTISKE